MTCVLIEAAAVMLRQNKVVTRIQHAFVLEKFVLSLELIFSRAFFIYTIHISTCDDEKSTHDNTATTESLGW